MDNWLNNYSIRFLSVTVSLDVQSVKQMHLVLCGRNAL